MRTADEIAQALDNAETALHLRNCAADLLAAADEAERGRLDEARAYVRRTIEDLQDVE